MITLFSAIGTALTGAIVALWKIVMTRANDCERKHEETQEKLLTVTKEVGELKGRIHVSEHLNVKIQDLSSLVEAVINSHSD